VCIFDKDCITEKEWSFPLNNEFQEDCGLKCISSFVASGELVRVCCRFGAFLVKIEGAGAGDVARSAGEEGMLGL